MKKRRPYFRKLFISYIILLLIPIVIFGYLSYFNIVLNAVDNANEYNLKTLNHCISAINLVLNEIDKTAINLITDEDIKAISEGRILSSEYSKYKILNKLTNIKSNNINIQSIYASSTDKIVFSTDMGFTLMSEFHDSEVLLPGNNSSIVNNWSIRSMDKYNPENNSASSVTVITKRYSLLNRRGFILINLNADFLYFLIDNYVSSDSSIYIINPSDLSLVKPRVSTLGDEQNILEAMYHIKGDLESASEGSRLIEINGTQFNISFMQSAFNHWIYMKASSAEHLYSRANSIKRLTIYAAVICLLAGLFASFVASIKAYKPVKTIYNSLVKPSDPQAYNGDEFSYINNVLSNHYPLVKAKLLNDIITGNNKELVHQNRDFLKTILPGPFFTVFSLHVCFPQDNDMEKLANTIMKLASDDSYFKRPEILCIDQSFVYILQAPENIFKDNMLKEYLETYLEQITHELNLCCTIGVGNTVQGIDHIHISYAGSINALDYQLVAGTNTVIFQNDFQPAAQDKNVVMLSKHLDEDEFLRYLHNRDADGVARYFMQSLEPFIKEDSFNKDLVHIIYQQFLFNLIQYIFDNKLKLDIDLNLMKLMEVNTVDDMRRLIEELSGHIIGKLSGNDTRDLLTGIAEYIRNNYSEDLSLESIAAKVYMSQSHLCRLFKQHFGTNPGKFLIDTRMEMAERLLITTNLQIQQIAEKVGYRNLNSFTKLFKRYNGVSPNEYRKQISLAKVAEDV